LGRPFIAPSIILTEQHVSPDPRQASRGDPTPHSCRCKVYLAVCSRLLAFCPCLLLQAPADALMLHGVCPTAGFCPCPGT
jgi:hypothetical protein